MVKINKGPTHLPPSKAATDAGKPKDLKNQTNVVAQTLAGLMGGAEDVQKKERADRSKEADRKKKLKALGQKCGIQQGDSPKEATAKIVQGVLSDHHDESESGFKNMVDDITDYIQEQNQELKSKFDVWIKEIQSET